MKKLNKTALRLAVVLSVLLAASGCSEKVYPEPEFKNGQFVTSVISGDKGQIISTKCISSEQFCYYWVRFAVKESSTNTRLLSDDDAISVAPLATVGWMRPYEITPFGG